MTGLVLEPQPWDLIEWEDEPGAPHRKRRVVRRVRKKPRQKLLDAHTGEEMGSETDSAADSYSESCASYSESCSGSDCSGHSYEYDPEDAYEYVDRSVIEARIVTSGTTWLLCRIFVMSALAVLNFLLGAIKTLKRAGVLDHDIEGKNERYNYSDYEIFANFAVALVLKPATIFSFYWQYTRPI